ncbi:MAG: hypothetical protein LBL39_08560 [Planctomycetaceae bacterium]|nr:hypothetical protein [Planctomycetaceae bacterium]
MRIEEELGQTAIYAGRLFPKLKNR